MFPRQTDPVPRVIELESEIKRLKRENETLRCANAELRDTNNNLKESLDEAVRNSRPFPAQPGPTPPNSELQATSGTADSTPSDRELQRKLNEKDEQLNRTTQQLSEMRKQLLDVQSRLTVYEQVTAATQRRELIQEGVYENIPTESVYEPLRFDPSQEEHFYGKLQPITHTGCSVVSLMRRLKFFCTGPGVCASASRCIVGLHQAALSSTALQCNAYSNLHGNASSVKAAMRDAILPLPRHDATYWILCEKKP